MSRPEHQAPAEIVYNDSEAKKYTVNTRIQAIQADMSYRALELLNLPEDKCCYLLDIGCGSGLSSEVLEDEGHVWVGVDISPSMLEVAKERDIQGDMFLQDIGDGFGFRPGTFDGAISISVIQWLCNADKKYHNPKKRLTRFFSTLYSALARGARAVFQFYPENPDQVELIVGSAMKCGFTGGLVVDYPNSSKAKKFYLCLFAGFADNPSNAPSLPKGLGAENEEARSSVDYAYERMKERRRRGKKNRVAIKDRNWVLHKKEVARKKGKTNVPKDSKYTGRKRKVRF
ncbi:S-adenosyl-L-methionine-dependent methyltransferase [Neocallimastix lanati (nom. inval.)]|jgi:18S rRNA (guanine1575-N7)-methyltransferase|uniref:S-adenosyl-L-methionine-dependent methyltransferase n=1 Tax=Neocallimastix californiae TaxID=1754190 RepID=A0A1Y2EMS6_9FUNG|nr:S-adenosyl-L-methionine-dependent methyltransferase [Neocallimastix sp. JGI-2020a]ORY72842.1 S-adenosyl-L-methionine-dependent methyltransferase [Neocallimastix californiae]|eukprot:ORY72842.1 S-adenosyl-L-methionine-dependent methyltransferase [Neocallimastix californiae]